MVKLSLNNDVFNGLFPKNTEIIDDIQLKIVSKMSLKDFLVSPSVDEATDDYYTLSFECEGLEKGEYEYELLDKDEETIGKGLLTYLDPDYNEAREVKTVQYNKNDKYIVYNG